MSEIHGIKYLDDLETSFSDPGFQSNNVPPEPVRYILQDKHGTTAITICDIQHTSNFFGAMFDITYAHAEAHEELPDSHSLRTLMPDRFKFAYEYMVGRPCVIDDGDMSLVLINLPALMKRSTLMDAGHEIGHANEKSLVHGALMVAAAIDESAPPDINMQMDRFKPAADVLIAYGRNTPSFHDDVLALLDISYEDPTLPQPSRVMNPEEPGKTLLQTWHSEAAIALSALSESYASVYMLNLVQAGHLHPGLTLQQLYRRIMSAARSYDTNSGTTHPQDTLCYAIRNTSQ